MAISFIIHFRTADSSAVAATLGQLAECGHDQWLYPSASASSLIVMSYHDLQSEYEQDALVALESALGSLPSASLIVRLRPSQNARHDASALALQLLATYSGIVDDTYSDLWTSDEIANGIEKSHGGFLDCYFTK